MQNLNILIVEDESLVAMELSSTIEELGYTVVDYATNSRMAKKILKKSEINLILMDINLGEHINGIDFYKSLETEIEVIYLTAYADDETISNAMSTSPLGYLVKPHKEDDLKVLLALAQHKMNNSIVGKTESLDTLSIGEGFFFNTVDDTLLFQSVEIKLTLKELKLLKLLIAAKGEIVSYKLIEEKVWDSQVLSSSSMRTLLYRLRTKLEHKLIVNEHNIGIKLIKE